MRRIIRTRMRRNGKSANFFLVDAGPLERVSDRIGIIRKRLDFGITGILRGTIADETNLASSHSLLLNRAQPAVERSMLRHHIIPSKIFPPPPGPVHFPARTTTASGALRDKSLRRGILCRRHSRRGFELRYRPLEMPFWSRAFLRAQPLRNK